MKQGPLFGLLSLLALALAFYLARDAGAIFLEVPLDPNEGWNAYHSAAAMAGHGLYALPFFINNYPPLSFYAVGVIGNLSGDFIIAGRLVSLLAFGVAVIAVATAATRMGAEFVAASFAALFFAAALLLASDYVAMDDPQLLGHTLQLCALCLLWQRQPTAIVAGLLFAISLFIKHNLLALPLAAAIFLWREHRAAAWRFAATGLGTGAIGLLAFRLFFGTDLLPLLVSPRNFSLANFEDVTLRFLSWSGPAILLALAVLTRTPRRKPARFTLLYLVLSLGAGLAFAPGDGVDANIFFDCAAALGLAGALALGEIGERRTAAFAVVWFAPLVLFAALHFADDNFAYTSNFRRQAARDISFLKAHSGPAACEMTALCYWAGKPEGLDIFNLGEALRTGARGDAALVGLIASRHFSALQFSTDSDFALGPEVLRALNNSYRLDHEDDNGTFFLPRQLARQARLGAFTKPVRSSLPHPTNGPRNAVAMERTTT